MLALLLVARVHAEEPIRFSGFATLALTGANDDQLGFRRDFTREQGVDDSWRADTDSLLGLQWNAEFGSTLEAVAQVVVKERSEQSVSESIEWAFLRWRPSRQGDLRLGRMGLDIFMLSDFRQVGYAMPSMRPVPDFYGIVPYYRFDGADYTHRVDFDDGATTLSAKLYGGWSDTYIPQGENGTGNSRIRVDLEPVWGVVLGLEHDPWNARLSLTEAHPDSDPPIQQLRDALQLVTPIWPDAADYYDRLELAGSTAQYLSAGLGYDDGTWSVQGEVARIDADSDIVPQLDAGYVSVGRRFGAFTLSASLSAVEPQNSPEVVVLPASIPPPIAALLEPLRAGTELAFNDSRAEQNGVHLALRWDVAPRRALKLQWDRWNVEPDGLLLWVEKGSNPAPRTRTIDVVAVGLDLVF
jgi:hypothetical protein